MKIIKTSSFNDAIEKYPNCKSAFEGWAKVISENTFKNSTQLKKVFNKVDKVGSYYIFNIGGNKLRLVSNIDFHYQRVFIRYILTHIEYEKIKWK